MGILYMIIVGFFVGLVARFLKPGRDQMGMIMTTLLGVCGALLGGFLGRVLGLYEIGEPAGFIGAVIGAFLLLFVVQGLSARRTV